MIKYESDAENAPKSNDTEIHESRKSEPDCIPVPIPQIVNDHPLMDMDTHGLPIDGTTYNNQFLQLQDQPMLGRTPGEDEDEDMLQNPYLSLSLPAPDDLPVDDNMAYFLSSRMDTFLGFQACFSSAYKNLYLLSANNRVLRHVLLAFVKYLNEDDRAVQAASCNLHLQKAIPQLQHALTFLNFDEGHILSIPLLAYLAFWWRNFDVAKAHLNGFYKMLLHAQFLEKDQYGKVSVSTRMPSLVLLMWRVAVRLDHCFGFMRPEEETIPPIKSAPESSRRYITEFIDSSAVEWIDYLVLTDELEDLRNLVVHYNRRAIVVQQSPNYTLAETQHYTYQAEEKVIQRVEQLEGKILTAATAYDMIYQPVFVSAWYVTLEPFPDSQFLHYSLLFKTLHHRFIEAIVENRAILIQTTITSHPRAGPLPTKRLQAAIEICCAFVILKERLPFATQGRGRLLEALMYAGYTFCTPEHVLSIKDPNV